MDDRVLCCPACQTHLVVRRMDKGAAWICPGCGGCLVGVALLRQGADERALGRFWSLAMVRPHPRRCPTCSQPLSTATMPDGPELDACRACFLVWCDRGELEQLPRPRIGSTRHIPHAALETTPAGGVSTVTSSITDALDAVDIVDAVGSVIGSLMS